LSEWLNGSLVPSPLRAGVETALNRPLAHGVVALALTAEAALRVALALVHPVFAVVFPPAVAVPLLGAAFPAVRAVARGEGAGRDSAVRTLRDRGAALLVAAVAGHAAALGTGTALFLLVDTPIRYALYAAGRAEAVTVGIVYVSPLAGVAVGALLAWSLATPGVVRVLDGEESAAATARSAIGATVGTAGRDPRRAALAAALNLLAAIAIGGLLFSGLVVANRARSLTAFLAIGVGGGLLTAIAAFGIVYPVHAALANASTDRSSPGPGRSKPAVGDSPTRVGLALTFLSVSALVLGAGAVRVTETRPIDASPQPLADDPTAMYGAALANTARASHAYENRFGPVNETRYESSDETATFAAAVDRRNRRYRGHLGDGLTSYADAGAGSPAYGTTHPFALGTREGGGEPVVAVPGYWYYLDAGAPVESGFGLPESDARGWTVVDRGDGTSTLELTGCAEVIDALRNVPSADATCRRARIRVRIDTERGVVTEGESVVNATIDGHRLAKRERYDVAVDAPVERPRRLGARSAGEWLWKLFAY
jgi:hypothetical protein